MEFAAQLACIISIVAFGSFPTVMKSPTCGHTWLWLSPFLLLSRIQTLLICRVGANPTPHRELANARANAQRTLMIHAVPS
jgi:hypothetical protein